MTRRWYVEIDADVETETGYIVRLFRQEPGFEGVEYAAMAAGSQDEARACGEQMLRRVAEPTVRLT